MKASSKMSQGPVYQLVRKEMRHYGVKATLVHKADLPSFEIRSEKGKAVIAAPSDIEFLYGVYEYAERYLGWDFSEPGNDHFDPSPAVPFPEDGVAFPACTPRVRHCGLIQEFPFDDDTPVLFDWMAKNKMNYLMVWMVYYDHLPEAYKRLAEERGIIIESGHHNFSYLIPESEYRKGHPEFFAKKRMGKENLLAGMPEEHSSQLCTTNPDLRREIVRKLLDYHRRNPEIKYLGLNPNDGFGWCECPECSKLYDPDLKGEPYSRSENYYRADRIFHSFIDSVSRELHKAAPELVLNFFAYINYCRPAKGFRLSPGTGVHLAFYWRCVEHDITDQACPVNACYWRDLLEWERVKAGGSLNVYEYYMGINFYLGMPLLHFDAMFREMQAYSEHHVDGVFTQFHLTHWSAYGMNYRLMSDAARGYEAESSIEQLFRRRFGKAANEARTFYAGLRKMLADMGPCHIPNVIAFLHRSNLQHLESLLPEAQALASKCPLLPGKALAVWMEYMIRFKKIYEASKQRLTPKTEVEDFLRWIHAHEADKLFVPYMFDRFFKGWMKDLDQGREWYYFHEMDWTNEYDRLKKARRGQTSNIQKQT